MLPELPEINTSDFELTLEQQLEIVKAKSALKNASLEDIEEIVTSLMRQSFVYKKLLKKFMKIDISV
jgi:hypothetical protein